MNSNDKNSAFNATIEVELAGFFDKESGALKKIFDAISVGIIFVDFKKRVVLFKNKHFQSIVKDKEEDILFDIYAHVEQNIAQKEQLEKKIEIIVNGSGEGRKLSFTTYKVDEDILLIFLRQITSRSIYLESREESQFYDRLSELVAEVAHEIGNPLSGINTGLQVMLGNITSWPIEKVKDYIERTINEINRLSNFLKRIREVSRESSLEIQTTNLYKAVEKVLIQNEELLDQKKIKHTNMVDKDTTVLIDEEAFHRIILNLINNSLHILTPGKEVKIYVEEIDNFYVKLVYRNNGKPIPEELMEKIFSPLYSTKDRGGGIGLAISSKLLSRMGGTMKAVPPEDGIGAKFVMYIAY